MAWYFKCVTLFSACALWCSFKNLIKLITIFLFLYGFVALHYTDNQTIWYEGFLITWKSLEVQAKLFLKSDWLWLLEFFEKLCFRDSGCHFEVPYEMPFSVHTHCFQEIKSDPLNPEENPTCSVYDLDMFSLFSVMSLKLYNLTWLI